MRKSSAPSLKSNISIGAKRKFSTPFSNVTQAVKPEKIERTVEIKSTGTIFKSKTNPVYSTTSSLSKENERSMSVPEISKISSTASPSSVLESSGVSEKYFEVVW